MVKNITRKWQRRQSAIKDKKGNMLMEKVRNRGIEYCRELYEDKDKTNGELRELIQELKAKARRKSTERTECYSLLILPANHRKIF